MGRIALHIRATAKMSARNLKNLINAIVLVAMMEVLRALDETMSSSIMCVTQADVIRTDLEKTQISRIVHEGDSTCQVGNDSKCPNLIK